jgi:hypothetical protein
MRSSKSRSETAYAALMDHFVSNLLPLSSLIWQPATAFFTYMGPMSS